MSSSVAILSNVYKSGCDTLVHHLLTVAGFLSSLPQRRFSGAVAHDFGSLHRKRKDKRMVKSITCEHRPKQKSIYNKTPRMCPKGQMS